MLVVLQLHRACVSVSASIGTLIYFQLSVRFMTVLQFNSHLLHELVARAGEDRDRRRHHSKYPTMCTVAYVCVPKRQKNLLLVGGAISLHSHKHRADYYEVSNKVNAL